ncbi:MAG: AraC-like transcriptional regulator QhpR [Pseudomonadales bacterium]
MKMIAETSKVLASAATGVVDMIEANNGDVDSIFGSTSIRLEDLNSPIHELSLQQFCSLFAEAANQTGNDNFGLHFGAQFEPKKLGAIGYAAISSPTLSAALHNMETYFPAHQEQSSFGLIQDSGILWLSYKICDPRISDRRQDAELSMGMFWNVFRRALGKDWSPLEVRFEHKEPENAAEHESVFGAPVLFGRRTNAIAFRRSDLEERMPDQDPYLFSIIEPFLKSRCKLHDNPETFASIVRNQIKLNLSTTPPTLSEIARLFELSECQFQQELHAHGLSFQDLLRAARQELSLHYIDDPEMPLTEVALLLGYSELSAFSRAFRNWTGMSPQRYRRTHKISPQPHTT